MLRASIPTTAIKIISAMAQLQEARKEDKKIYINSFSISKTTGLSWETVDNYLANNLFIKEIQNNEHIIKQCCNTIKTR